MCLFVRNQKIFCLRQEKECVLSGQRHNNYRPCPWQKIGWKVEDTAGRPYRPPIAIKSAFSSLKPQTILLFLCMQHNSFSYASPRKFQKHPGRLWRRRFFSGKLITQCSTAVVGVLGIDWSCKETVPSSLSTASLLYPLSVEIHTNSLILLLKISDILLAGYINEFVEPCFDKVIIGRPTRHLGMHGGRAWLLSLVTLLNLRFVPSIIPSRIRFVYNKTTHFHNVPK